MDQVRIRRALDQQPVAFLALGQGPLRPVALDRIPDRSRQHILPHASLHQVILRAGLHRFHGEILVRAPGEHHDGNLRRHPVEPLERLEAMAVRQAEVQQHHVEALRAQARHRFVQPVEMHHGKPPARCVRQLLLHDHRVGGIVLDQQHLDFFGIHYFSSGGSVAVQSQKSWIVRTTSENSLKSIGLLMKQLAWWP